MHVQYDSSSYRGNHPNPVPAGFVARTRDIRTSQTIAVGGARDRGRTGMPGLAAAGFKPAVYTNFTTLANMRMILDERNSEKPKPTLIYPGRQIC